MFKKAVVYAHINGDMQQLDLDQKQQKSQKGEKPIITSPKCQCVAE